MWVSSVRVLSRSLDTGEQFIFQRIQIVKNKSWFDNTGQSTRHILPLSIACLQCYLFPEADLASTLRRSKFPARTSGPIFAVKSARPPHTSKPRQVMMNAK